MRNWGDRTFLSVFPDSKPISERMGISHVNDQSVDWSNKPARQLLRKSCCLWSSWLKKEALPFLARKYLDKCPQGSVASMCCEKSRNNERIENTNILGYFLKEAFTSLMLARISLARTCSCSSPVALILRHLYIVTMSLNQKSWHIVRQRSKLVSLAWIPSTECFSLPVEF